MLIYKKHNEKKWPHILFLNGPDRYKPYLTIYVIFSFETLTNATYIWTGITEFCSNLLSL